jgi:hypothetical protein
MQRAIALLAFLILAASNGFLGWQLQLISERLTASEARFTALATATEQLIYQLKGASEQVDALKATAIADKARATSALLTPTNVAQLSIAQSYRLDLVVEWIGLIEDKIFFILFQPPDPVERETRAAQLRVRTEEIRGQFQAVALQEQLLRNDITKKVGGSSAAAADEESP